MTQAQNEGEEDTRHHELVIIRRRGNSEDEPHHGGVWKIAHADFMTALMAFFLVMWLITATDDKTVAGVANYFNPMRLSDQTTRPKGVFTMEPGGSGQEDQEGGSAETGKQKDKGANAEQAAPHYTEEALFKDPYEALDKIASQVGDEQAPKTANARGGPALHGGDAFRDPFNPENHYVPVHPIDKGAAQADSKAQEKAAAGNGIGNSSSPEPAKAEPVREREQSNGELKREIEELVRQSGFAAKPGIDVRRTDEGLLIGITDQFDFEMFGIASAQPTPELVVLMDKIGKLLAARSGQIVVRGHTDGRPFRSEAYDNWRLSTARAHMAHYMLVRSGVPEERIARVEGYADHELKIIEDPFAAANRRIEILLEEAE